MVLREWFIYGTRYDYALCTSLALLLSFTRPDRLNLRSLRYTPDMLSVQTHQTFVKIAHGTKYKYIARHAGGVFGIAGGFGIFTVQ